MEDRRKIAVKPMPRRDDAIELVAAHMRDQGYEFITADRLRNKAARSKTPECQHQFPRIAVDDFVA